MGRRGLAAEVFPSLVEGFEFALDQEGVEPFEHGQNTFERQFFVLYESGAAGSQLTGGGQQKKIGNRNAVNGGDKGDADAMAHCFHVGEMFHDLNQSEHGSNDSDGGGVTAGAFEDSGFGVGLVLGALHFPLHDFTDGLAIGAIDRKGESFPQEWIGQQFELRFERYDSGPACFGGERQDLGNRGVERHGLMPEDGPKLPARGKDQRQRGGDQHSAGCAT